MSKELVISSNRQETKVAILEDDQLVEVYFQRSNEYSLAGSIHKGRVTRVLPGMQSAFVDLGLERDTFLYVSDFFEENEDIDTVSEDTGRGPRNRGRERERERTGGRPIVEAISVPAPAPVVEIPADSETVAPAPVETAAPESSAPVIPEIAEVRAPESAERGGRRGRRSRRRRSRGRGFPENKYAQPSGSERQAEDAEKESEDETEERAALEPIILPGESLAKYRAASASNPIEAERALANEPEPGEPATAEESADIEERAEELETADRILSHNLYLTPQGEEEKIDEVRTDQAASSPFIVSDIETEEQAQSAKPAISETRETAPVEPVDSGEIAAHRGLHEDPHPETSSEEVAEAEGLSAAEFTEVTEFEDTPVEDIQSISEEPESEGEAGGVADTGPQTATVREQGGRYMHRVSRRMRRRRGGNRFGTGQQQAPQPAFEITAPAVGGAAPALESDKVEKPERVLPSISDLLKPGQEIIVQIAKEPLGQKGARITSHIALPGRYVVFMPSVSHLGVSRKVESEEERQRLKRILQTHRVGTTGGFIVRTAGEGIPEEEIAADMDFLYKLWLDIRQKAEKRPAPMLLHCDLDIVQRILRDQVTDEFKAIWVDNEETYESALSFVQRFQPALVGRVKMYTREAPIFDAFGITQELEKALRPKVWLKSGGYIVINQTEALVAIDINTGKYVGKSNRLEDTIVKTNTEAVKEIVRQIRLRDLGGIIVVDFIDMDERKNRQKVMQALEEAMQADKAPYKILQFNDFGLVAITRKRVKQSLERTLCSPCPYCEGAGYVKSVQTIISEILVEAQKIRKALDRKDVVLRVNPDVARVLKANDNKYLEELEETLGRPVLVKGDAALHHEKFDLG